ncbi:hypothetical protein [Paenibacillus polymyxa]|uniref:hypothetical protein n=1 Tax=Paenibacillus polymyxa TaxID=1406 RepID=UPI001E640FF2|nr:hypothetical protein [Paenibacillus polymyxa]
MNFPKRSQYELLGAGYMYHARWDECIATLQQHLAMPQARWADNAVHYMILEPSFATSWV